MVAMSTVFGTLAGLPLGVFLATSRRGEILAAPAVNGVLGLIVNATRSVPFIILVVRSSPSPARSSAHPSAPPRPSCR